MNWYKVFYWMTVANNVGWLTGILAILCGIVVSCMTIAALGLVEDDIAWRNWKTVSKRLFMFLTVMFFVNITVWTLIPSKKEMMIIIAGGAIGNFVSSDSSSKAIPAEMTRFVRNYLKDAADGMDPSLKKEMGLSTEKDDFVDKLKDLTKEQIIEELKKDTTFTTKTK